MINIWLSEAESKTGFVTCAFYLTLIGSTLAANIPSIPRLVVMGSEIDIKSLVNGHYIQGNERDGYKILGTDILLPNEKLKLFTKSKKSWKDETIMIQLKKSKKKIREARESSRQAAQQANPWAAPPPNSAYWSQQFQGTPSGLGPAEGWDRWEQASQGYGQQAMPPQAYGQQAMPPPSQAYGQPPYGLAPYTGPYIPPLYPGRAPDTSYGAQFRHLPQPERSARIMGAYSNRNMEDVREIQNRSQQLGEGVTNMAYQFGLLSMVPPDQFQGGLAQPYYEQGYYTILEEQQQKQEQEKATGSGTETEKEGSMTEDDGENDEDDEE